MKLNHYYIVVARVVCTYSVVRTWLHKITMLHYTWQFILSVLYTEALKNWVLLSCSAGPSVYNNLLQLKYVGEEIKVNHWLSAFEDSNSRSGNKGNLVPSSSCGQGDSDCNESGKEFDEANDDHLEDGGQDLM